MSLPDCFVVKHGMELCDPESANKSQQRICITAYKRKETQQQQCSKRLREQGNAMYVDVYVSMSRKKERKKEREREKGKALLLMPASC